jgi:transposase InsO family protein
MTVSQIKSRRCLKVVVIISGFRSRESRGLGVGHDAGDTLTVGGAAQALITRHPPPRAVYHSDRGIEYAAGAYVQWLRQHSDDSEHEPAREPVPQRQL